QRGLSIAVAPASEMALAISGSPAAEDPTTDRGLRHFAEFLTEHLPYLPPSQVEITSELPISSGFGSSAALCTALAQWSLAVTAAGEGSAATDGVSTAHTREWREVAWHRAHELETFFHGTPSGIDTGLAALGGVQAFHFQGATGGTLPSTTALSDHLPPLVVGSIPRNRSTRELVAMVHRRHEQDVPATTRILSDLGSLADEAIAHLSNQAGSPEVLGEMASAAQARLAELGVSSPVMERILSTGVTAGAVGGKLSGAGDGGAFYLVCADTDAAATVRAAVSRELPPGGSAFVMERPTLPSDMEPATKINVPQQRAVEKNKKSRRR
ncbi:MAG TPA: hypothetical protein VJ932_10225, partial [Alkalispirochaeta sp.]|nr:hypothetical protein [Alkalispirochaeta sp.]